MSSAACRSCAVVCDACAIGERHFNIEPAPSNDPDKVTAWNSVGNHHVMWNGTSSEIVKCGSRRASELAKLVNVDEKRSGANTRQVGGEHYGLSAFQHWDIVVMFDLDYFQGQITKYVMRWKKKNGVQDLEKAAHFLEKYIQEIKGGRVVTGKRIAPIKVVDSPRPE